MTFELKPCPKPVRAKRTRAPLRNRKPMKRTKMRCGAGSKRRKGHMFPKNVDQNYRSWIRTLPCVIAERVRAIRGGYTGRSVEVHHCWGNVQACHVKSRGTGGRDVGNIFPGCANAHDEQGRLGVKAFERRWRINLTDIAAGLGLRYHEQGAA